MKRNISVLMMSCLFSSVILPTIALANESSSEANTSSTAEVSTTIEETLASTNTASEELVNQSLAAVEEESSLEETTDTNAVASETATSETVQNNVTVEEEPTIETESATEESDKNLTRTVSPTASNIATSIYASNLTDSYQPHPEVESLKDALTDEDLANAVGNDGMGVQGANVSPEELTKAGEILGKYENVNNYIAKKKFANPSISKDKRFNNLPKNTYKQNRPIGVVVHETANPNSSLTSEVNYMYNNYENAFVHAFVDNGKVVETAPTEYLAWGAGKYANPYYIHIELVREKTFHNFAKSVNNDAYWIALQLYQWGLTPSLADNNNGKGTVISHNAVSKYLGGTNHVDPVTYFSQWGYNMDQFYALIQTKYKEIKASDTRNAKVTSRVSYNASLKVVNDGYNLYTNAYNTPGATVLKKVSTIAKKGKNLEVKEAVVTNQGAKVYALKNGLYVDQKALEPKATIIKETPVNKVMSFKDTSYFLYNKPYNTVGASRQKQISDVYYNKQQVKVLSLIETSEHIKVYKLETGLYVDRRSMGNLSSIKLQTTLSPAKTYFIKSTNDNIYSKPYNTAGMTLVGKLSTKVKVNQSVTVTSTALTSIGLKNYYIKGVGWVDPKNLMSVKTYQDTANFKTKSMRVKSIGYNIYKAPYQTSGWALSTTMKKKYSVNDKVQVTRYGKTSAGVKTYYIKNVGWVDAGALKAVPTFKDDAKFKAKSMRVRSVGYNIYKAPYHTENWKLSTTMKKKYSVGDKVQVTRYGKTSNGVKTYYIKNVGWVDSAAVEEFATYKAQNVNKQMKVVNSGYYYYKVPYGTNGAKRTGQIKNNYKNGKIVKVTKMTTTSKGVKTYYISGKGWVDAKALK